MKPSRREGRGTAAKRGLTEGMVRMNYVEDERTRTALDSLADRMGVSLSILIREATFQYVTNPNRQVIVPDDRKAPQSKDDR